MATVQPELLAHHYTEAGLVQEALPYWQRAGQQAAERSAHVGSDCPSQPGSTSSHHLPETRERDQQELTLRIDLGSR